MTVQDLIQKAGFPTENYSNNFLSEEIVCYGFLEDRFAKFLKSKFFKKQLSKAFSDFNSNQKKGSIILLSDDKTLYDLFCNICS